MCLPAILVLGLDLPEKQLLLRIKEGSPVGVAALNQYGGVPVIRKLQSLGLAVQTEFDSKYGRPRWIGTPCGQAAAGLLDDLQQNPLLEDVVLADYKQQMLACPRTKPHHRTNPGQCQCH